MKCKVVTNSNDVVKCVRLAETHYNEVERKFTGLPYKPKVSLFLQLYEADLLCTVALYDGRVVEGYVMFSITPSLLNDGMNAQEIGLFVMDRHRGSGWFKQMLSMAEEELQKMGASVAALSFKAGLSHALPEGYVETETIFIKSLEA